MRRDPVVWAVHDGKAGMASQALGLAEATGFPVVEKRLSIRFPWRHLPPRLWLSPFRVLATGGARIEAPWPDLVIGCGRSAAAPVLAIRRASGGRAVAAQIQKPEIGRREFDLLVVPEHDRLRGDNVIVTRGAVHRVTASRLASAGDRFPRLAAMPRPILAVLIGGSNKAYRLSPRRLGEIGDSLAAIVRTGGGSVLLTPSRRTGAAGAALLHDRLAGVPAAIWDGAGENPYFAYLALADAVLVTADSISMISEAAATGKPVHILELDGGNAKFARFHAAMRAAGVTRPFAGMIEAWSYPVPDDTAMAGRVLRALVLARFEQRGAA